MNEQIKENNETKGVTKKFYQKKWFWIVVGILGVIVLFSSIKGEDAEEGDNAEQTTQGATTEVQTSIEDYKALCNIYTYEELARNPNSYKGKKVALKGEMIQVLESGRDVELRINVNGEFDETVYVIYTLKDGEGRILENDVVDIYGTFAGLLTYESVLGSEITLPRIDARYVEIVK